MKTIINALFATVAIAFTASASPALLVETTITERHSQGGKDEKLIVPRIKTLGQVAEIQIGQIAFTTKATLAK